MNLSKRNIHLPRKRLADHYKNKNSILIEKTHIESGKKINIASDKNKETISFELLNQILVIRTDGCFKLLYICGCVA